MLTRMVDTRQNTVFFIDKPGRAIVGVDLRIILKLIVNN
jgi:hypothetical protein